MFSLLGLFCMYKYYLQLRSYTKLQPCIVAYYTDATHIKHRLSVTGAAMHSARSPHSLCNTDIYIVNAVKQLMGLSGYCVLLLLVNVGTSDCAASTAAASTAAASTEATSTAATSTAAVSTASTSTASTSTADVSTAAAEIQLYNIHDDGDDQSLNLITRPTSNSDSVADKRTKTADNANFNDGSYYHCIT